MADSELLVHVFLDQVHGHVPRAFDHHLAIVLPGNRSQLAQGFELGELRLVVGVRSAARAEPIAEREADIVGGHDVADVAEVGI